MRDDAVLRRALPLGRGLGRNQTDLSLVATYDILPGNGSGLLEQKKQSYRSLHGAFL